jgi:aryl-alcohol dehydrogenase-like predicted oxidoreductase
VRRGHGAPPGTRLAQRAGYITEEKLDQVEALIDWAGGQGVSVLDVAVGGLAALPGCTSVIAGAMSAEQVKMNAAAGNWVPTAEQLTEIGQIVPPPAGPE